MRASRAEWGQHRVVVCRLREDRVDAMKAVREAHGGGLTEANNALEDLPRELCVDVSERARLMPIVASVDHGRPALAAENLRTTSGHSADERDRDRDDTERQ